MGSTSPEESAGRILDECLAGASPRDVLAEFRRLAEAACDSPEAARALFGILVEGLSDRFEAELVHTYACLFAEAIAMAAPEHSAAELVARYGRVRRPRPLPETAAGVVVLSRVTLGADIAVTSAALDAARRRYPAARIRFAAPRKNWELFAGDPRIEYLPVSYGGSLRERIAAGLRLREAAAGAVVLDPDSRLTQLGLLPVCPEEDDYFFESRAREGDAPLAALAREWCGGQPFLALAGEAEPADVAISFGTGGNERKRVPDPFERDLVRGLAERGLSILIDTGAGGEEARRVQRAAAGLDGVRLFQGGFADFAAGIGRCRVYIGYDSAGQHAAAVLGVPLITVFAGFPCERFFRRWQPCGPGPKTVIRVEGEDAPELAARVVVEARMLLG